LILSALPGGPAATMPQSAAPQNTAPQASVPQAAPTTAAELPYPEIVRVSLGDAKAAYDLKQAVYLDVRDADSYANSHIPDAVSIPLNNLETRLKELDPNAWILTYCT
jgi:3-mercaptopyruvate sulfurtransferase SseA